MTDLWRPQRCLGGIMPPESRLNLKEELTHLLKESRRGDSGRRTHVYHPSAVGGPCKRVLYYQRTGGGSSAVHSPTDEFMFKQGHALHDIVQNLLTELDGFVAEVPVENVEIGLYGHADGLFVNDEWVVEIKTIGDASFRTLVRPQKRHIIQGHCYMYCLDVPRIQFVYVNRNTLDLRCFRVNFDLEVWREIQEELEYVEQHVLAGTEVPRTGSVYECRRCSFQGVCKPEENRHESTEGKT